MLLYTRQTIAQSNEVLQFPKKEHLPQIQSKYQIFGSLTAA